MSTIDRYVKAQEEEQADLPLRSSNREQILSLLDEDGFTLDVVQRMYSAADTLFTTMEHLRAFLRDTGRTNEDPSEIALDILEFHLAMESMQRNIPVRLSVFPAIARDIKNVAYVKDKEKPKVDDLIEEPDE